MNHEEFEAFINKQDWIFAKTYATTAPHEYIVRNNIKGDDEEFMKAVDYIYKNGCPMHWNDKYVNKYVHLNGHNYWVMMYGKNDPTGIINRSLAKDYWINIEYKPARRARRREKKNVNNLQRD